MSPDNPDLAPALLFDKHTIETPEQLRLDFAIAGIGSRFLALALDTLIQSAVAFLGILVLIVIGWSLRGGGSSLAVVWTTAIFGLLGLLLFFGYFAIFEIFWNGQTPGKRVLGIRVVKDSGRPLTVAESIGRNLLRIVDQLPAFYAVGILAAVLNSRNKRLGDMLAGSIVVRESSLAALQPEWQAARPDVAGTPVSGAAALNVEDLALIDAFLNRRGQLDDAVRSRMADQIVKQLRPKLLPGVTADRSPESVLESLAWERRSSGG